MPRLFIGNIKGTKGDTGSAGISATHSWNGTILTITSAGGTSSADLRGEPGKDGSPGKDGYTPQKNIDYFDGEPGADGYTPQKNVDYFDGEPGKDGYSPVRGVDYWTEEDKSAVVNEVGAKFPKVHISNKTPVAADGKDGDLWLRVY